MNHSNLVSLVDRINNSFGTSLNHEDYSGYLVKKLTVSSSISIKKETKGYHIELTDISGPMSLFPVVTSSRYLSDTATEYKRDFYSKLAVILNKNNLNRLINSIEDRAVSSDHTLRFEPDFYKNEKTSLIEKDDFISSFTIGAFNVRGTGQNQSEIGTSNDGAYFLLLRYLLLPDDYLIFLKRKDSVDYNVFGIENQLMHEGLVEFTVIENAFFLSEDDTTPVSSHQILFRHNLEARFVGYDNIIFYGPPGTGKTFYIYENYLSKYPENQANYITFHQAYSYEEFIEGIRPELAKGVDENHTLKYQISDGIFYKACLQAIKLAGYSTFEECFGDTKGNRADSFNSAPPFYFCIDEINRANVVGVFGDLITLIESDKRLGAPNELKVLLPYSKREFGVPLNLRIIGGMNSADRSISLLDTALRRRFVFIEIPPDYDLLTPERLMNTDVKIDVSMILRKINHRIEYFLGKEQAIGHAYFINLRYSATLKRDLLKIFLNNVLPLLEEYFYHDYKKIRLVLGDVNKSEDDIQFFTYNKDSNPSMLFGSGGSELEENEIFSLNKKITEMLDFDEFKIPDSLFVKIYE